jgi:crossover junction endodeoxyribonuclease RuvC
VIESDGLRSRHVTSGCVRLDDADFLARLGRIFAEVTQLISVYGPQEMAIEQVFVAKNVASAMKLGQARGAAICAAVSRELRVFEYSPRAVKRSVVGTGAADKEQVQHMVTRLLDLSQMPSADAADALAVALSHAHTAATQERLARAAAGWRR